MLAGWAPHGSLNGAGGLITRTSRLYDVIEMRSEARIPVRLHLGEADLSRSTRLPLHYGRLFQKTSRELPTGHSPSHDASASFYDSSFLSS